MNLSQIKSSLILLLVAVIWGFAFVAQSQGMDYVGPYTFVFTRSIIAGIFLLPVIFFIHKRQGVKLNVSKELIIGGICCGLALGISSLFQQFGISQTSVGKAGFITALYIVIVPIIGLVFRNKPSPLLWISIVLAVCGLYFLTMNGSFTVGQGDLLVFICALCFSCHILVIDHFSPKVEGIALACIQFFVVGALCLVPMLLFEKPSMDQLFAAWQPILYAGVLSSGVGYTLQIVGQKGLDPTVASLIMSFESVFSVIAGFLILGQALTLREGFGCVLMFIAIVLAQIPAKPADSKT